MEYNKQNVFEVYDKIGDWFAKNRPVDLMEKKYLDKVISLIPAKGTILDVGCGTGIPILRYFINSGFKVAGVDASKKMLSIAKKNFPDTHFILADMRTLFIRKKYNAIIAWHSFFHLPAANQPDVIRIFKQHLNPKGILLFTSGTINGEAWSINGGENLFHASLNTSEYKSLLEKYNFNIVEHKVNDPECGNATIWMAQYNPQ